MSPGILDSARSCLVLMLAIALLIIFAPFQVDASEAISDDSMDGTISRRGCEFIDGKLSSRETESGEVITLCEYRDKILKTFDTSGCLAAEGFWVDPETGESFTVPSSNCDMPEMQSDAFCKDAAFFLESDGVTRHYVKNITIDDVSYPVDVKTLSAGCYGLSVRQDTKDMHLVLISSKEDDNRAISVSFPAVLLRGNYTILVDGSPINASLTRNDSTVTFSNIALPEASDGMIIVNRVQIIGTEVIATEAYSSNVILDGTITSGGCRIIGGDVIEDAIDFIQPARQIAICQYGSQYYKITELSGACAEVITPWNDPETGRTYNLPTPCDVPTKKTETSCDGPPLYQLKGNDGYFTGEVQVVLNDSPHYILIDSINAGCQSFQFLPSEKKIHIVAGGFNSASMNITIPSDLLSGDFRVLSDGNATKFSTSSYDGYSVITVPVQFPNPPCPDCESEIDIIGTELIPEFFEIPAILSFGLGLLTAYMRIKK